MASERERELEAALREAVDREIAPHPRHAYRECRACGATWWGEHPDYPGRERLEAEWHRSTCPVLRWRRALSAEPRELEGEQRQRWIDAHERAIAEYSATFRDLAATEAADPERPVSSGMRCPVCGGPPDNGHDREDPPNAYTCSRCALTSPEPQEPR